MIWQCSCPNFQKKRESPQPNRPKQNLKPLDSLLIANAQNSWFRVLCPAHLGGQRPALLITVHSACPGSSQQLASGSHPLISACSCCLRRQCHPSSGYGALQFNATTVAARRDLPTCQHQRKWSPSPRPTAAGEENCYMHIVQTTRSGSPPAEVPEKTWPASFTPAAGPGRRARRGCP